MSVRTTDTPDLALEALADQAQTLLDLAIADAVDLSRLESLTPRDTGELARSWTQTPDGVANTAPHASYVLGPEIEAALPTGEDVEIRFTALADRLQEDRC